MEEKNRVRTVSTIEVTLKCSRPSQVTRKEELINRSSRKPVQPVAVCPKCGTNSSEPRKSWVMPVGKTVELTIGVFDCPKCGKAFRKVINKRRIEVRRKRE